MLHVASCIVNCQTPATVLSVESDMSEVSTAAMKDLEYLPSKANVCCCEPGLPAPAEYL